MVSGTDSQTTRFGPGPNVIAFGGPLQCPVRGLGPQGSPFADAAGIPLLHLGSKASTLSRLRSDAALPQRGRRLRMAGEDRMPIDVGTARLLGRVEKIISKVQIRIYGDGDGVDSVAIPLAVIETLADGLGDVVDSEDANAARRALVRNLRRAGSSSDLARRGLCDIGAVKSLLETLGLLPR